MKLSRLAVFSWFLVGYNVLVILWGAFVRASGSGAGCGSHWPLCNGEVVPLNPSIERTIEFTHRVMSGVDLPLILLLAFFVFRAFPWGRVRYGSMASVFFIITEALIGMTLVTAGLVAGDQSPQRAFWVALHLFNTFLLLSSLTLTARWVSGGRAFDLRANRIYTLAMGLAVVGVATIGVTGAVTALGDTLFPATSLAQGIQQDTNPAASFLIQLRVIHPILAVIVGTYLLYVTVFVAGRRGSTTRTLSMIFRFIVVGQILAGGINVLLLAPTWMQIVHLFLADMVWIVLTMYAASVLGVGEETTPLANRARSAMGATAE